MTIVIRKRAESVRLACVQRKRRRRTEEKEKFRVEKRSLSTMTGSGVIVVGKV